jgi:hypothetical protein
MRATLLSGSKQLTNDNHNLKRWVKICDGSITIFVGLAEVMNAASSTSAPSDRLQPLLWLLQLGSQRRFPLPLIF